MIPATALTLAAELDTTYVVTPDGDARVIVPEGYIYSGLRAVRFDRRGHIVTLSLQTRRRTGTSRLANRSRRPGCSTRPSSLVAPTSRRGNARWRDE